MKQGMISGKGCKQLERLYPPQYCKIWPLVCQFGNSLDLTGQKRLMTVIYNSQSVDRIKGKEGVGCK